jgi:hypothetical protein
MKRPYIIYALSKERTTQRFTKSNFPEILKNIDIFLQSCTTAHAQKPSVIELTAYTAHDHTDPADILLAIVKKTLDKFSSSVHGPNAFRFGGLNQTDNYTWEFECDELQDVIQYLIENSRMPKASFGPLELYLVYDFKLTNPVTHEILQNQEQSSSLLIWLSRRKACAPELIFPFEQPDKEFWNYLDSILPFLPFKLEEKYLRIAHVNKQGEIKSFKKIQRQF